MKKFIFLILTIVLLYPHPCSADTSKNGESIIATDNITTIGQDAATIEKRDKKIHPIDKRLQKAIDRDISTANMKKAGRMALGEWEQELEKYYSGLIKELNDNEKVFLEKSQKDWQEYRKSEIEFFDALYGTMRGSMFSTLKVNGRMELVKQRALELKRYYDLVMEEKDLYE